MKKWLDDLYAILLKRGFNTLDNSLKNYDSNQSLINKITRKGIDYVELSVNGSIQFNISNYNNINDLSFFLVEGKNDNNSKNVDLTFLRIVYRNTLSSITSYNLWTNSGISISTSGTIATITNVSGAPLYIRCSIINLS